MKDTIISASDESADIGQERRERRWYERGVKRSKERAEGQGGKSNMPT